MKTWTKGVLGCLALPVILIVGGIVALVATGKWKQVVGFGSGVLQLKHNAEILKNLDHEYPFTPPADGLIPEDRLNAYAAVCEAVKPAAAPYEAWFQAHQGQQGEFKAAELGEFGGILLQESGMKRRRGQHSSSKSGPTAPSTEELSHNPQ